MICALGVYEVYIRPSSTGGVVMGGCFRGGEGGGINNRSSWWFRGAGAVSVQKERVCKSTLLLRVACLLVLPGFYGFECIPNCVFVVRNTLTTGQARHVPNTHAEHTMATILVPLVMK